MTNVNQAPTDISLSSNTIDENLPSNTVIGNFTTTDPDAGDTHTYTLVAGTGSGDNGSFNINGNQLRSSVSFNYEAKVFLFNTHQDNRSGFIILRKGIYHHYQ